MKDFAIEFRDGLEFGWSEGNQKWELCQIMDMGGKIVIAFFDSNSEGYDMRTVGARFFEHDGAFHAGKMAMKWLELLHELEDGDGET